ncbi:MAG: GNAT family N-acetyltransferase [Pseudomonadota bacterium]
MMEHAPTVTSKQLILRGYLESDYERFAEFGTSKRACFVGGPVSAAECWRSFMAAIGHWTLRGYGMWVIEDRESGHVAGRVGIILNDGWHEPELAWHIYEGFEGKSVAYRAALLAREYSARHFGLNRVMSYISKENQRSIRLATRLGAIHEKDVEMRGAPTQMWRHPSVLAGVA